MRDGEMDRRVAELEARVAALEAAGTLGDAAGATAATAAASRGDGESGEVRYGGTVRLHGEVDWTIRYGAAATLELADPPAAAVLAALGHPTRAALVRRLLAGPAGAGELRRAAGLSSTGQLYHHLRSLTAAHVVEQDSRGSYRVPPTAVVPALVLLLAAADIAGELR